MIISLLASISFAIYFIEIAQMPRQLGVNRKPFNCVPCLAAWAGLFFYFMPTFVCEIAIVMFSGGIIATLIVLLLDKIFEK